MEIFLAKTLSGFAPANEEAKLAMRRYKPGEVVRCKLTKPRDYTNHKRYFALLNLTFENQDKYDNFEIFRKAVQIAAGHVDEIITLDGEIVFSPRSIDYATLDELEFGKVMAQTMTVCAKILGDLELHELEMEVARYAA